MNKLLRSEWIKWSTIRMNWILALIGILLSLGLVVVLIALYGRAIGDSEPDTSIESRVEIVGSGAIMLTTFAGVLGVRVFGNEYRTKTMMPSIVAAPLRTEVTVAKALTGALIGVGFAIAGVAAALVTTMVGLEIKDFPLRFDDPHMLRITLGTAGVVAVYALVGTAVGAIFTSPALGIALVIAVPAVVEPAIAGFLPGNSGEYLPFSAGQALIQASPAGPNAAEGGAIFLGFAFLLLIAAGVVFQRRDLG